MSRILHDTTKCVRCFKPAKTFCGWVQGPKNEVILAGWCSVRCRKAWETCHGLWNKKMGKVRGL